MPVDERPTVVTDLVEAQLVECVPEPVVSTPEPLPQAPEVTPTAQAAQATIEQTGAGPPPQGDLSVSLLRATSTPLPLLRRT